VRWLASSPIVHTIPDVMAMLSCSRSLVYEMITRGDIAAWYCRHGESRRHHEILSGRAVPEARTAIYVRERFKN
jgi:hypothetical protein